MINFQTYAGLTSSQKKIFNYLVKHNLNFEFIDWTYEAMSDFFKIHISSVKRAMLKFQKLGLLNKIKTDGKKILYQFFDWVISAFKNKDFYNQKRTVSEPSPNQLNKIQEVVMDQPLNEKEIPPDIHISNNTIMNDNEDSFVQDSILSKVDQACKVRYDLQTERVQALAKENYKTYNKPIRNPSSFMNNCIDRALDWVNRIIKPNIERNEQKTIEDRDNVFKGPVAKTNTIPDEVKQLDRKELSNGFKIRVFPSQINVYKGKAENLQLIEIKNTDLDFHEKIEFHILKYLKE